MPNTTLPFAITLEVGSSLANHTGSWRTKKPVYVDRLPPCNAACPAGENIQAWLYLAEEGRYREAWDVIVEANPFPAIHGRICYHPCESACNRGQLDSAVNVHAVERFIGDLALREEWTPTVAPATGKRILVVGAGPCGLSAAFHLARLGHAVTVRDAGAQPGGMMRYGIPAYRLPRDILDGEIARLTRMGVRFVQHAKVDDIAAVMAEGKFDAAFLAVGAGLSKKVEIPGREAGRILDALKVLKDASTAGPADRPQLGRRVAVVGGGNTAMDAARTAKRLGAEEAVIIYRRDQAHMPAHPSELAEALEEGVQVRWLSTISQMSAGKITVEKMALDEKGFPKPTGEYEELSADSVILAIGQDADTSFLKNVAGLRYAKDGSLLVDEQLMAVAGPPALFAGGDMTPGDRTATRSVGNGKYAARCIDAQINGKKYTKPARHDPAEYSRINPWYYTDAPKQTQEKLDHIRRLDSFAEIQQGLDETSAMHESRRCLSCGNCFECDNCFGVCPDNAVIKLGPGKRFAINYDYCKGCGLCATECPCGAIDMVNQDV